MPSVYDQYLKTGIPSGYSPNTEYEGYGIPGLTTGPGDSETPITYDASYEARLAKARQKPAFPPAAPTASTAPTAEAAPTSAKSKPKAKAKATPKAKTSGPLQGLKAAAPPTPSVAPPAPAAAAPEDVLANQIIRPPINTAPVEGPGGGAIGGGTPGLNWMSGPSALRSGIGQRTLPNYSMILAGLGRVY